MSEIVNLRRACKEQTRKKKCAQAEANQVKHGVPKHVRNLSKAQEEKEKRAVEGHKLDGEK